MRKFLPAMLVICLIVASAPRSFSMDLTFDSSQGVLGQVVKRYDYQPDASPEKKMGFVEAVVGQQRQNLIPKAWDWATRKKPEIDLTWKNPVLDDLTVPARFHSNFYGASSQQEYDEIKARVQEEMKWEQRVATASSMGKMGVLVSRLLDPVFLVVIGLVWLIYYRTAGLRQTKVQIISTKNAKPYTVRGIKPRIAVGWIVGIVASSLFIILLNSVIHALDIPTYIDFGETITVVHSSGRQSYDEEVSGAYTAPGEAILFAGLILGILVGRMAAFWPNRAPSDIGTRATVSSVLLFLSLYGVGGAVLLLVFKGHTEGIAVVASNLLKLGLIVLSFLAARKLYRKVLPGRDIIQS